MKRFQMASNTFWAQGRWFSIPSAASSDVSGGFPVGAVFQGFGLFAEGLFLFKVFAYALLSALKNSAFFLKNSSQAARKRSNILTFIFCGA